MFAFSFAGLLVGIAVGATGVGGGSLMTPILILFLGVAPATAVGTDLLYASISKGFGVFLHGKNGSVDWKIVRNLAYGSVPAALITLVIIHNFVDPGALDKYIKVTLGVAVTTTALFSLLQERLFAIARTEQFSFLRVAHRAGQKPLTIFAGVLIGSLVTISSVGAGVIGMMFLLILYPGRGVISLVGTDLAHAVLITTIAGIGHIGLGTVDYRMLGYLLIGAIPGIYIGTRLGFRLPNKVLKKLISGFLVFIGVTMLLKALS